MEQFRGSLRPGDRIRAQVVAVSDRGIQLQADGADVLVHVTDVPWYQVIHPADYAEIRHELDVTILRSTEDGRSAAGWLPWPGGGHPVERRDEADRHQRGSGRPS